MIGAAYFGSADRFNYRHGGAEMEKKYKYILLDADETLFDFTRSEATALSNVLTEIGIEPTAEVIGVYHNINDMWWARFERGETTVPALSLGRFADFAAKIGITKASPAVLADRYRERLGECCFMLDGAEKTVRELSKKYTLYIITNGLSTTQRRRFGKSPINSYISGLYISEEIGFSKPDPQYFEFVLKDAGISDRSSALVVGDSLRSDIRGGIAAGLDTCWLNRNGKTLPDDMSPTYIIGDISELCSLL